MCLRQDTEEHGVLILSMLQDSVSLLSFLLFLLDGFSLLKIGESVMLSLPVNEQIDAKRNVEMYRKSRSYLTLVNHTDLH